MSSDRLFTFQTCSTEAVAETQNGAFLCNKIVLLQNERTAYRTAGKNKGSHTIPQPYIIYLQDAMGVPRYGNCNGNVSDRMQ